MRKPSITPSLLPSVLAFTLVQRIRRSRYRMTSRRLSDVNELTVRASLKELQESGLATSSEIQPEMMASSASGRDTMILSSLSLRLGYIF